MVYLQQTANEMEMVTKKG